MSKVYVARRNIALEFFQINKPHGYAIVSWDPLTTQMKYEVVEPTLMEQEIQVLDKIREYLKATINTTMAEIGSREEAVIFLRNRVEEAIKLYRFNLSEITKEKILYYVIRDHLDFDKIDVVMKDPLIEDISCNGPGTPIYVWHRTFESIPSNISFNNEDELDEYIIRLAYKGKRMISVANPLLDASLPDGSRIQMTFGKYVTKQGSTFTIRKFKADPLTIVDLIKNKTISADMAALIWYLVENKTSIFVCGGIASGKTTMLNCLTTFIAPDVKIVTIEDTPEIYLYHKNWIRAITRPSTGSSKEIGLFDLLRAAMRQRPDYILVGEIRGEEAYTLFQAMGTGHLGLSTLHAESVDSALRRLETEPMNIPKMMIASLNMVIVMARRDVEGNPVRKVITCAEVKGLNRNGNVDVSTLIEWNPKNDTWHLSHDSYYLKKEATRKGITIEEAKNDVRMRTEILTILAEQNKRSFSEVTQVIRDYVRTPKNVHDTLVGGTFL